MFEKRFSRRLYIYKYWVLICGFETFIDLRLLLIHFSFSVLRVIIKQFFVHDFHNFWETRLRASFAIYVDYLYIHKHKYFPQTQHLHNRFAILFYKKNFRFQLFGQSENVIPMNMYCLVATYPDILGSNAKCVCHMLLK